MGLHATKRGHGASIMSISWAFRCHVAGLWGEHHEHHEHELGLDATRQGNRASIMSMPQGRGEHREHMLGLQAHISEYSMLPQCFILNPPLVQVVLSKFDAPAPKWSLPVQAEQIFPVARPQLRPFRTTSPARRCCSRRRRLSAEPLAMEGVSRPLKVQGTHQRVYGWLSKLWSRCGSLV